MAKTNRPKRPKMKEFVLLTQNMTFDSVSHVAKFLRVPYQTVYSYCTAHPQAFSISTPPREGSRRCRNSFYLEAGRRLSELSTLARNGQFPSSPGTMAAPTAEWPQQSVPTPVESTSAAS